MIHYKYKRRKTQQTRKEKCKMYRIETRDGVVIRKQATRPYQEAIVTRKEDGTVTYAENMTSKAKHADNEFIKSGTSSLGNLLTVRYERVVAIDLENGNVLFYYKAE